MVNEGLTARAEYSFVVPHDVKTLVELMGGPETFERRLDMMVGGRSSG